MSFLLFVPFEFAPAFCLLNGDSTTTVSEDTFEFLFSENVLSSFALFPSTLLFDCSSVLLFDPPPLLSMSLSALFPLGPFFLRIKFTGIFPLLVARLINGDVTFAVSSSPSSSLFLRVFVVVVAVSFSFEFLFSSSSESSSSFFFFFVFFVFFAVVVLPPPLLSDTNPSRRRCRCRRSNSSSRSRCSSTFKRICLRFGALTFTVLLQSLGFARLTENRSGIPRARTFCK